MLPSPGFWDEEKRLLWESMAPFLIALVHAGGESGYEQLPDSVKIFMNWDVFNQDAIDYLRSYRLGWVTGISETSRTQSVNTIAAWIESGASKDVLDKKLATILSPARAKTIATTEVTRVYARGNQLAWKATGMVTAQKWQTVKDDKTCPICSDLHDKTVSIDSVFTQSPTSVANTQAMKDLEPDPVARQRKANTLIRNNGASHLGPPAHPNCRCFLLPVVSIEGLERELDKFLSRAEIECLVSVLESDTRVVLEGKLSRPKFKFWKPKKEVTKEMILPIIEEYYGVEKEKDELAMKELMEAFIKEVSNLKSGDTIVNVEPTPVTIKNVIEVPSVTVEAPDVKVQNIVETPEVKVEVQAPEVTVEAPQVTVENTVESPVVNVVNELPESEPRKTTVKRDRQGNIIEMETK